MPRRAGRLLAWLLPLCVMASCPLLATAANPLAPQAGWEHGDGTHYDPGTVPLYPQDSYPLSSLGDRPWPPGGTVPQGNPWPAEASSYPAADWQAGSFHDPHVFAGNDRADDGADWQPDPFPAHDPQFVNQFGSWQWTLLPNDILFAGYLAGERESKFASVWAYDRGRGWLWDIALGGRAGIARWGSVGIAPAEGWQLDIEGAAFPRLDPEEQRDLDAVDFRFGVPLTWAVGPFEGKIAYSHLCSHIGDEYLIRVPGSERRNYVRDSIVLGYGYFPVPDIRLYGELELSFFVRGGADPLAVQFGAEYSPVARTGITGAPFAATNIHLREELEWSGSFVVQTGWQWRSPENDHRFRAGFQYRSGASSQTTFLGENEQYAGLGLWFDY